MIEQVVLGKKALGTSVVAGREVYLSKPEGVLGVIWQASAYSKVPFSGRHTCNG